VGGGGGGGGHVLAERALLIVITHLNGYDDEGSVVSCVGLIARLLDVRTGGVGGSPHAAAASHVSSPPVTYKSVAFTPSSAKHSERHNKQKAAPKLDNFDEITNNCLKMKLYNKAPFLLEWFYFENALFDICIQINYGSL
jgi:hypothetical protein